MRRHLRTVVYGVVALTLSYASYHYTRNGIMRVEAQQTVVTKPYVADYVLTSYVNDPKGEIVEKRRMGLRSDGASFTAFTVLSGPGTLPHREIVVPDGRKIRLNDSQQVRTTLYLTDQELASIKNQLLNTQTSCGHGSEVLVENSSMVGFKVVVWQTDPKQHSRMTFSRAPELGCLSLETKFAESINGKFVTRWILAAQRIDLTGPSVSDMDTGDSYQEVTPSEMEIKTQHTAALVAEASKSEACSQHQCAPVEELQARWTKEDNDYQQRKNGGK